MTTDARADDMKLMKIDYHFYKCWVRSNANNAKPLAQVFSDTTS